MPAADGAEVTVRGRAIRPAYEGIETFVLINFNAMPFASRAIRPAYEGIETTRNDLL